MKANFETGLKICTCCKKELPLSAFSKNKRTSDGFWIYCNTCVQTRNSSNYKKNRDKIIKHNKKNCMIKKDQYVLMWKNYYQKNKEKISLRRKKYGQENREKLLQHAKEYLRERRIKGEIQYILKQNLRSRIITALKGNSKSQRTISLLGCSIEEFRKHIESQFQEGMTWKNYGKGGWELDHIIPIAYFDLSDPEQQKLCWNYRNLQPLWRKDNIKKSDLVPENVEELVNEIKIIVR